MKRSGHFTHRSAWNTNSPNFGCTAFCELAITAGSCRSRSCASRAACRATAARPTTCSRPRASTGWRPRASRRSRPTCARFAFRPSSSGISAHFVVLEGFGREQGLSQRSGDRTESRRLRTVRRIVHGRRPDVREDASVPARRRAPIRDAVAAARGCPAATRSSCFLVLCTLALVVPTITIPAFRASTSTTC